MNAALQDGLRDHRHEAQLQLVREHWSAVRRLWLGASELPDVGKLRSNLPVDFWIGCGMPGLATVTPTQRHRFQFTEDGEGEITPSIIIPCYDCIPGNLDANPERHVDELRDLVAIDLDRPDRHWRRRGESLVLGTAFLEIARQEVEPVPVFKNPLSWLRAGGAGVCILDWDYARDLLLDHELIAEDIDLGDRLAAALKPDIWVMEAAA